MLEPWLGAMKKVRYWLWLAVQVAVLVLLVIYKITVNETALMLVFLSMIAVSIPLTAMTMVIDAIETDQLMTEANEILHRGVK